MKDFQYPDDIYTEAETDPNTLANLGPLAKLAGVWHKLMAHNSTMDCVTTPILYNQAKWKPSTIKWAIGYGNQQQAIL